MLLCDSLSTFLPAEAILFLPALLANVDGARIPDPDDLDVLLSTASPIPYIHLAFHSLRAISQLVSDDLIPSDARLPRALAQALEVARFFSQKSLIFNDDLFATNASGALDIAFSILSMATDGIEKRENFYELVDGTGGTIQDLACAVIQHFFRARANPDCNVTDRFLSGFRFLHGSSEANQYLDTVLHSLGFLPVIITTISALHGTAAVKSVQLCLGYLVHTLKTPSQIAQALQLDLLPAIVVVAASTTKTGRYLPVQNMLDTILPQSLVHYVVVSGLKKPLQQATDYAATSGIDISDFSKEWASLAALMKTRVAFLGFLGGEGERHVTTQLLQHSYSSVALRANRPIIVRKTVSLPIGAWGIKWSANNYDPSEPVLSMYGHPGEEFFTVFTYRCSYGAKFVVAPKSRLLKDDPQSLQFSRAVRSSGRMELHVAKVVVN
ncbi:hypothetical protein DFH06DRAFT_1121843 [Mycena polygramma]|nr:hypothetical protein DFH06DRAFT_1121843 [Mycena polygramma]